MAERLPALRNAGLVSDEDLKPLPPMPHGTLPRRASPPRTAHSHTPARLQKAAISSNHSWKVSDQFLANAVPTLPSLQQPQPAYDTTPPTLLPPPPLAAGTHSRSSSQDYSRPGTPGSHSHGTSSRPVTPVPQPPSHAQTAPVQPAKGDNEKAKGKHWWSKSNEKETENGAHLAWVAGHPHRPAYDAHGLLTGQAMQELWDNEEGNCTVHLFTRASLKGPSFKVDSAVFASSPVLTKLAFGEIYSNPGTNTQAPQSTPAARFSAHDPSTPPLSPKWRGETDGLTSSQYSRDQHLPLSGSQETQLYLPIKLSSDGKAHGPPTPRSEDRSGAEDLQALIDHRNLFAFLCGQSLVATERKASFFSIFITISNLLKSFHFSNLDSSTYGEIASASFDNYVEELGLADVRSSREKTIEGIVLGERMKSVFLYNEAFTHAVGKHEDLLARKTPRYDSISSVTQNRLIRAARDLDKRTASIRLILTDFDFPFLFSGIMNSKSSEERKDGVRFAQWKESFLGMRKYVLGAYKHRYGDWPPKASSKKNSLATSGLNRLVLQDMYNDLSSLYDLWVDRSSLTTRTIDGTDLGGNRDPPTIRGLRRVLSEYDQSAPPVKPPIPFDLPKMPTLRSTRPEFGTGDAKKDAKDAHKKIKDDEIAKILQASWNDDIVLTPFVEAFREMEKRAAHGCSLVELEDLRIGQWIFMYAVLQALPMLACDAPGLRWTRGVEYFLCEPPRSGVPWADPNAAGGNAVQRTWFSVGGVGGGVVSLPSDVVEHGVEGIYRRSHCWQMAQKWTENNPILNGALSEQQSAAGGRGIGPEDLSSPPAPGHLLRPDSRASNTSASSKRLSSIGMGLEALPLPPGVTPDGRAPSVQERPKTPMHAVDATRTFDAILANVDNGKGKKKKK